MARKKVIGVCPLCGRETKLAWSHVLPKWMFKGIRDGKDRHRIAELKIGEKPGVGIGQDGPTEPLLCESCDNAFSDIEGYAENVFSYDVSQRASRLPSFNYRAFGIAPVDYRKLKLFWILNLFRMSIAQGKYFAEVQLEPEYVAELRKRLISRNPGPESRFAFTAVLPVEVTDGKTRILTDVLSQFVLMPSVTSWNGTRIVRLVCAGLVWAVFVPEAPEDRPISLFEEGKLLVFLGDLQEIEFLTGTFKEIVAAELHKQALNRL